MLKYWQALSLEDYKRHSPVVCCECESIVTDGLLIGRGFGYWYALDDLPKAGDDYTYCPLNNAYYVVKKEG